MLRNPAGNFTPEVARHEGRRLLVVEVEVVRSVAARDRERVAESLGGDERRLDARPLSQGVDHDGRAVRDECELAEVHPSLRHHIHHAMLEVRRGRLGLRRYDLLLPGAGVREEVREIGERAAHVRGRPDCRFARARLLGDLLAVLVQLARLDVAVEQRLDMGSKLLADGVLQPASVRAIAFPLRDHEKGRAAVRTKQSAAEEAAALLGMPEDLELGEGAHERLLTSGAHRQPQYGDDGHVRLRLAQASSDTAPARIKPLITYCHWGVVPSRSKPLPIITRKKAPRTVRQIAPSPPYSDVPPRTIAVIASNSMPLFAFHCAVDTSEKRITPAIPAASPETANVAVRITLTRTPDR